MEGADECGHYGLMHRCVFGVHQTREEKITLHYVPKPVVARSGNFYSLKERSRDVKELCEECYCYCKNRIGC